MYLAKIPRQFILKDMAGYESFATIIPQQTLDRMVEFIGSHISNDQISTETVDHYLYCTLYIAIVVSNQRNLSCFGGNRYIDTLTKEVNQPVQSFFLWGESSPYDYNLAHKWVSIYLGLNLVVHAGASAIGVRKFLRDIVKERKMQAEVADYIFGDINSDFRCKLIPHPETNLNNDVIHKFIKEGAFTFFDIKRILRLYDSIAPQRDLLQLVSQIYANEEISDCKLLNTKVFMYEERRVRLYMRLVERGALVKEHRNAYLDDKEPGQLHMFTDYDDSERDVSLKKVSKNDLANKYEEASENYKSASQKMSETQQRLAQLLDSRRELESRLSISEERIRSLESEISKTWKNNLSSEKIINEKDAKIKEQEKEIEEKNKIIDNSIDLDFLIEAATKLSFSDVAAEELQILLTQYLTPKVQQGMCHEAYFKVTNINVKRKEKKEERAMESLKPSPVYIQNNGGSGVMQTLPNFEQKQITNAND